MSSVSLPVSSDLVAQLTAAYPSLVGAGVDELSFRARSLRESAQVRMATLIELAADADAAEDQAASHSDEAAALLRGEAARIDARIARERHELDGVLAEADRVEELVRAMVARADEEALAGMSPLRRFDYAHPGLSGLALGVLLTTAIVGVTVAGLHAYDVMNEPSRDAWELAALRAAGDGPVVFPVWMQSMPSLARLQVAERVEAAGVAAGRVAEGARLQGVADASVGVPAGTRSVLVRPPVVASPGSGVDVGLGGGR